MINQTKNIFADIPQNLQDEVFEKIITSDNFFLERIVSDGQSSPKDFWYDQETNEFVMVVQGSAKIIYDDETTFLLAQGDYIIIPAHQKHRVEETDKNQKTIWLALHYK